ncbi:docking protein 3 isoform X2 [Brachyhypopomus gauderio]
MYSAARLELFEYRQASGQDGHVGKRADSKKVVLLRDCIQILEQERRDCPKDCSSFLLETADKLFTFAAQRTEVQCWIQELCRLAFPLNQTESRSGRQGSDLQRSHRDHEPVDMMENSLYETAPCSTTQDFQVIAVSTEAAVRCHLQGEYILSPQSDCLVLKDPKTKKVILSWPYCFVRKFGQDMLTFSFEAGRRCESGEGCFEFATSYGNRLFSSIDDAIKKLPHTDQPGRKQQSIRKSKDKDQPVTQNSQMRGGPCEYSEVQPLPGTGKAQKAPLGSMFRSMSLNSFDPSPKSQGTRPEPPPVPGEPESVYAMISKPQPTQPEHKTSSPAKRDYGLWTDPVGLLDDPLPEEMSGSTEADDPWQEPTDELNALPVPEDYSGEAIYAEPEDYDARTAWQDMADYPVPEEFWNSDEARDSVEEQEMMPYTSDPVLDSPKDCFLTYDNISRKKL